MKKTLQLLVICVVLLLGFGLVKNSLVQAGIGSALAALTKTPVSIQSVNLSILRSSCTIHQLKIRNPKGFAEQWLLQMPLVSLRMDVLSLFSRKVRIRHCEINLSELNVIVDKNGLLNVDCLKSSSKAPASGRQGAPPSVQIDQLVLSIGRVVYKDYSKGTTPQTEVFEINMNKRVYTNVQSLSVVSSLILSEILSRSALSRLVNINIQDFSGVAGDYLNAGIKVVSDHSQAVDEVVDSFKSLFR